MSDAQSPLSPTVLRERADRLDGWINDGVARGWPDVQDDLRTAARILRAVAATPGPLVTTVDTDPLGDDPVCPSCGAVRGRTESRIDRLGCVDVWHEGFGTCPVRVLAVTEDVMRGRLEGLESLLDEWPEGDDVVDRIVRALFGEAGDE